jgi:hypothetical protein
MLLPGMASAQHASAADPECVDDGGSWLDGDCCELIASGCGNTRQHSAIPGGTETRDRCSRLAKALKRVVKGRKSHRDEFASVNAIAADAGLPEGWVVNAIHSKLLGVVFPDDKWDAQMDGGRMIRVSPTFGLNHLFDQED